MFSRRKFLSRAALSSLGVFLGGGAITSCEAKANNKNYLDSGSKADGPLVIATWNNDKATAAAWEILKTGGRALDAVEQGVWVPEGDPNDSSVGYGGLPDRNGRVTLDACIMDENGNGGSVCCLEHIKHPISVARKVMEETPHVILVGQGALDFALEQGFEKENLLTTKSEAAWKKWLETSEYKPIINIENHDTIGMLAMDQNGDICGACTTSGLAYKRSGRVGDSPILGAGMFVDNEIGGAVATGLGEAVLKTLGSFLVVELMRQGYSPQEACEEAVNRIVAKQSNHKEFQVGYLAMNKAGEYGGYSIQPGFTAALQNNQENTIFDVKSHL